MRLISEGYKARPERTLYIHQSDLDNYRKCPEQTRLDFIGELFNPDSDAAFIGTCMHSFIEECLHYYIHHHQWPDIDDLLAILEREHQNLINNWETLWHHPHQIKDLNKAMEYLTVCCQLWFNEVRPTLNVEHPEAWLVEQPFDIEIWSSPAAQTKVRLRGKIDFWDGFRIKDWKSKQIQLTSTGKIRDGWKIERYDIQSTMYTWALSNVLGQPVEDFDLCFMPKKPARDGINQAVVLPLHRDQGHWDMMIEEALALSRQVLNLKTHHPWPLGHTDWWCSARWCSEHAQGKCMGQAKMINPEDAHHVTRLIELGVKPERHDAEYEETTT